MERQGRSTCFIPKPRAVISTKNDGPLPMQVCAHSGTHKEVAQESSKDLDGIPYLFKETCKGFVCQHDSYTRLAKHFAASDDVHGAINSWVLLWGRGGHGKRQTATHLANSLALTQHRTVLWVEGSSHITFLRDLRLAYVLMTGKDHPSGVSIRWQLWRISRSLGLCKSKWFMVIFDLNPDLQNPSLNPTGIDLTMYLPDGQILVTYSPKMYASDNSPSNILLPLQFSTRQINDFQDDTHDLNFVHILMNNLQPPLADALTCSETSLKRYASHLLSAALGSSIAHRSRLTLDQYQRALHHHKSTFIAKRAHRFSSASLLTSIAWAMERLMQLLRNTNTLAAELLIVLSTACSRDIPVRLLQKLGGLKYTTPECEDALEYLQSLAVIHVRTLHNGERFIDLHHMIHSWLNKTYRGSRSERDPDFRKFTKQWIITLDLELVEIKQESDQRRYWMLLHLALTVASNAEHIELHCAPLITLLRKIATFMSDFLITPVESNRLLARALYLTADMRPHEANFNLDLERLKLHCGRSRLCALLGDFQQARQEIDYATSSFATLKDTDIQQSVQCNMTDELIELMLRQGDNFHAKALISGALFSAPNIAAERKGRLHYWAVCCASDDRPSVLKALQHSHLAMAYWQSLPEDERWGNKSFSMIAWVDAHTDLLLQMERGRGALVFMPKILDHYIEQCPPVVEAIWRVAYCLVRENVGILELDAAEEVACRVLSLCELNDLNGSALSWALMMLFVLGAMLARRGRYLESEGIFKTCLDTIETRRPPHISGQGDFSEPSLWMELCHTLLVQGKVRQAEAVRDFALQKGFNNLRADNWKDLALEPRRHLLKSYKRALQAARDRNNGIYNAEDHLLDVKWPKTFSLPIEVLGNPFVRIKNGLDDIENVHIPTSETSGQFSAILELLNFRFDFSESDTESQDGEFQSLWKEIFPDGLTVVDKRQQSQMWDHWRRCSCRRNRQRSLSISFDTILHNEIVRRDDARKLAAQRAQSDSSLQKRIIDYFPRIRRYPASACLPDCPCVKVNTKRDSLVSEIERERLYVYQSPNIVEREAKHAAYLKALRQYRYRFGPRPAVPYGMSFITRWRKPKGPTESNGGAKKQHEFFWAPDFVFAGDSETNWGFLGQDENYVFTNPAMTVPWNGAQWALPDLPNIIITSHKLGEEVRGNIDLFDVRGRKKWFQTNINDYLEGVEDSDVSDIEETNPEMIHNSGPHDKPHHTPGSLPSTPPAPPSSPPRKVTDSPVLRPRRRRGRKAQREPMNLARSSSSSSSVIRSRPHSPANNHRSNSNDPHQRTAIEAPPKKQKLKLFDINSLHSLGPVFDIVTDPSRSNVPGNRLTSHENAHFQDPAGASTSELQPIPPPSYAANTTNDEIASGNGQNHDVQVPT